MRKLLAALLWFALLASVGASQPAAAGQVVLKFSHFLGPESFFQRDFAEPLAQELETLAGGQVKVEIYNSSSPFGDVAKQAEQVEDGKIDIALGLCSAEDDRFPRTSIIELPFAVQDALDGSRALWGLYKDGELGDEYKDFKVLALFVHNPGLIHTTFKRIVTSDDLKDQRLRVPNKLVAGALQALGATPVVLQANDVMAAVKDGSIDGIVTNWGNPLADFNMYMKRHTDIAFYTSAFFLVMNKSRYDGLPPDIRAVIDKISNGPLVTQFGLLWSKWDRPVRDGASGPGQEIIVPDAALMAQWRRALRPFTEQYLDELVAGGFGDARAVYARIAKGQAQ